MIIRINDEKGNNVAECEILQHDIGIWRTADKTNIENIFVDIVQGESGFTDVIDIDVNNIISPKKLEMIKCLAGAWCSFETLRTEYELGCSDDDRYLLEIIGIPHTFGYITDEEHQEYVQALTEFLQYDGTCYNNDEYTYEELDEFIRGLNPVYKIF